MVLRAGQNRPRAVLAELTTAGVGHVSGFQFSVDGLGNDEGNEPLRYLSGIAVYIIGAGY